MFASPSFELLACGRSRVVSVDIKWLRGSMTREMHDETLVLGFPVEGGTTSGVSSLGDRIGEGAVVKDGSLGTKLRLSSFGNARSYSLRARAFRGL